MKLEEKRAKKRGMLQKRRRAKTRTSPWIVKEQPPKQSFQTTDRGSFLPLGCQSQIIRYYTIFYSSVKTLISDCPTLTELLYCLECAAPRACGTWGDL